MGNQNKVNFFLFVLIASHLSFADTRLRMHDFETSHLKSTGGTGVGSVLVEESAFLNPAPIAFFNLSSLYFQKDSIKITDDKNNSFPAYRNYGFVLAQAEPPLSGTFSYTFQKENNMTRKRFGISLAAPISQVSALGISVRSSHDDFLSTHSTKKYYQSVIGVSHAISESTSVGVVAYDVFKSKGDETKLIVGIQQSLLNYISGALDIGGNYTKDELSKTMLIRGGIQVRLLDDFFVRVGGFNDKENEEKGEGYGVAWIQPKLSFELALKNTKQTVNQSNIKNKETSFSISLRGF